MRARARAAEVDDTLEIAAMLPGEREDLIHEATGSMLRAVSKRDGPVAEAFLRRHLPDLPRMMPRYASEAYPPELRERYLREDV